MTALALGRALCKTRGRRPLLCFPLLCSALQARGLNELAEPGNEIECEQVIWRPQRPHQQHHGGAGVSAHHGGQVLHWSRYVWRRGSVPLWWSVKIKNQGIGEAEIKIQQNNTFKGSRRCESRGILWFPSLTHAED